jgi:hypothetical protein
LDIVLDVLKKEHEANKARLVDFKKDLCDNNNKCEAKEKTLTDDIDALNNRVTERSLILPTLE